MTVVWACLQISQLLFSHSVMSLQPCGLQYTRLPCPSLSLGAYSHSCPLSQWCHPTISSSVAPFSSCLQSFPASGSFKMSQLFTSVGQSLEAWASVLPMHIQGWFTLGLTVVKGGMNRKMTVLVWEVRNLWKSLIMLYFKGLVPWQSSGFRTPCFHC